MMTFSGTLLPQTNAPEEIQKSIVDILQKLNQLGAQQLEATGNKDQFFPVGYFATVDIAAGGSVAFPKSGAYIWHVCTYGATYNGTKSGTTTGATIPGTASANLTLYYKRIG